MSPPHFFEHTLLEVMLDPGHQERAVSRLMQHEGTAEFPFGMIQVVIWRVGDVGVRLVLLRGN